MVSRQNLFTVVILSEVCEPNDHSVLVVPGSLIIEMWKTPIIRDVSDTQNLRYKFESVNGSFFLPVAEK